jgi:predicted nucleic acid-binding protein
MTVLADSGAIYALLDRDDNWHDRVRGWWERNGDDVRLPVSILPEVAYLVAQRLGADAELAFIDAVAAGDFTVEQLEPDDFVKAAALMRAYSDTPIGFVDASVAATAERIETVDILTTDRRHFAVLRPARGRAYRLVP